MNIYQRIEQFVIDAFTKAGKPGSIKHLQRTTYWIKQLDPKADEAMLIAAVSHDIERAFRDDSEMNKQLKEKGFEDEAFLTYHQTKGAELVGNFLSSQTADPALITRVKSLIEKHEVGGSDDQNTLKDADSISFFENNANTFVEQRALEIDHQRVQEKLDWMFNRITSEKAKEIARLWYGQAVSDLKKRQ
jgi:hypothetical protein